MIKKKIIIVGNSHPSSIEIMFYNSFKNLNQDVHFLDPNKFLFKIINNKFFIKIFRNIYFYFYNRVIFKFLNKQLQQSVIFFFKGDNLNAKFLNKIKTKFIKNKFINYNTDNPFYNNNNSNLKIKSCIKYFDYYFTWSKEIKDEIIKNKLHSKGRILHLPFAYDSKYRKKLSLNNLVINNKILFYGSWDKERELILNQLDPHKIDVYGNAWENSSRIFKAKYNIYFKDIYGAKLANLIRGYGACLNVNRPQVGEAHNMRLFEVTGHGGLLITKMTKETNSFFKNKDNCVLIYKDLNELKKTVRLDLNKLFLRKMRKTSYKMTKYHSYDNRCNEILTILKNDKTSYKR